MDSVPTQRIVVPKPVIPRTIGSLNIAFASILLLCGACTGFYYYVMPGFGTQPMMKPGAVNVSIKPQADRIASRNAEIAELRKKEEAAKTDAERKALEEKREDLQDQAELEEIGQQSMVAFGFNSGFMKAYLMTDLVSAVLLNLLMLVAGVGLIQLRAWGRTLGMWVAATKILRLVAIWTYCAVVITPLMSKAMLDMLEKMEKVQQNTAARNGQPAPPRIMVQRAQIGKSIAVMYTGMAIGVIVFGSIYPAIALGLLSTEGCRAACQPRNRKPKTEANDPWQAS